MSKLRTIKLSSGWPNPNSADGRPQRYRVEQITDATDYDPGQWLDKREVQTLCESSAWKVTIVAKRQDE